MSILGHVFARRSKFLQALAKVHSMWPEPRSAQRVLLAQLAQQHAYIVFDDSDWSIPAQEARWQE